MYSHQEVADEPVVLTTNIVSSTGDPETSEQEAGDAPSSLPGLVFGSLLGALLWLGLILTGAMLIR